MKIKEAKEVQCAGRVRGGHYFIQHEWCPERTEGPSVRVSGERAF